MKAAEDALKKLLDDVFAASLLLTPEELMAGEIEFWKRVTPANGRERGEVAVLRAQLEVERGKVAALEDELGSLICSELCGRKHLDRCVELNGTGKR